MPTGKTDYFPSEASTCRLGASAYADEERAHVGAPHALEGLRAAACIQSRRGTAPSIFGDHLSSAKCPQQLMDLLRGPRTLGAEQGPADIHARSSKSMGSFGQFDKAQTEHVRSSEHARAQLSREEKHLDA